MNTCNLTAPFISAASGNTNIESLGFCFHSHGVQNLIYCPEGCTSHWIHLHLLHWFLNCVITPRTPQPLFAKGNSYCYSLDIMSSFHLSPSYCSLWILFISMLIHYELCSSVVVFKSIPQLVHILMSGFNALHYLRTIFYSCPLYFKISADSLLLLLFYVICQGWWAIPSRKKGKERVVFTWSH